MFQSELHEVKYIFDQVSAESSLPNRQYPQQEFPGHRKRINRTLFGVAQSKIVSKTLEKWFKYREPGLGENTCIYVSG